MADRTQPPYDDKTPDRRTPVNDDLDPDGMDSQSEADELEAGAGADEEFVDDDDHDDGVEPDGVKEAPGKH